jgi:hypothetical protein
MGTDRDLPPLRRRISGPAAIAIGLLLVAAAGLKLYGIGVSAVPSAGRLSSPPVQTTAAVWEFAIGLWLLTGRQRPFAWAAAVATFVLFSAVSGYLGSVGVARCGCFGVIEASPWVAFAVDVTAVAALLVGRPRLADIGLRPFAIYAAVVIGGASSVVGIASAVGVLTFGSVEAGVAWLRGEQLTSPDYVDFGDGPPGGRIERSVEVANHTDHPVRLLGGTSDCSCVTTTDLPLTLPANGRAVIAVRIGLPTSLGVVSRRAELWTDCDGQRTITLRLGARVVDGTGS